MINLTDIDYLGIERVLKRGTGEIIASHENAFLVRDKVSKAYFLACEDEMLGMTLLDQHVHEDCHLLMVTDFKLGRHAFEKYDFSEKLECFQVAYYGEPLIPDSQIRVKAADQKDISLLIRTYDLISPEEMMEVVERGNLLLGYDKDHLVGFIGEHLEGSMGMLYIFPEYRRKGFASALEKIYISKTIEKGFIPFGQVEKSNRESLNLQKKIGMTQSDKIICWMWK